MKDSELYRGFSPEKQAGYEAELIERFGPGMRESIATSRIAWDRLDDAGKQARLAECGVVEQGLTELMRASEPPESIAAEPLLARHRAWVASMWNAKCSPKSYAGLGSMYTDHPDFRARFEAIEPGFAEWFAAAMRAHAARHMPD